MCKKKREKERKKLNHQLILYTRINSKLLEDLNINHDTIKVLAENVVKFQISHLAIFLPIYLLGQEK